MAEHGTLEHTRHTMSCFFDAMRDTGHKPQHIRQVLREFGFAPIEENALEPTPQPLGGWPHGDAGVASVAPITSLTGAQPTARKSAMFELRERIAAPAAQPADSAMEVNDLEILEAVRREMDENDGGNAPGHGHSIPGIWDYDNGAKAGKPCAWCLTWKKFTALIERDRARALTAASKERSKTHG